MLILEIGDIYHVFIIIRIEFKKQSALAVLLEYIKLIK